MRNKRSVWANIGASSHSDYDREKNDYYSTDPIAIDMLEKYNLLDKNVDYWECACGDGALSKRLNEYGYNVISSDLFDRGYGESNIDFLNQPLSIKGDYNIITNPPYSFINDFVEQGLKLTNNKLYIFARIQTLEGITRYDKIFKDNPPVYVCPFVKRVACYKSGLPQKYSSAVCYAWFIWDNKINNKETLVKWLI